MSVPLFRHEVVQARRARWLGGVVLDHPPGAAWAAALVALACVLVVVALGTGEYTRRTRVAGQLVPSVGTANVVAPVAGIVEATAAEEGATVAAGAALLSIRVPTATATGDAATEVAASLARRREATHDAYASRRRRLAADARSLASQQADARDETRAIDAEIATRAKQLALAEELLERYRVLQETRLVADLQVAQQQAAVLEQHGARQLLWRQRAALERQQAQLAQAVAAIPEQAAQLDADEARDLAALDQEATEQRARHGATVRAPVAGRIGTRLVQPGQAVQAGQPLLTLLPAGGELQAHLQVPGGAIGFVTEGATVRLRYDAFPYQRFGHAVGRIVRVSRDALQGSDGEPRYRVVVALARQSMSDGAVERPLRPGLVVQAELHGERRRLWRWAVEPLRTLQASITGVGTGAAPDGDEDAGGDVGKTRTGVSARRSPRPVRAPHGNRRVLPRSARCRGLRSAPPHRMASSPGRCRADRALASDPGRNGVVATPAIRGSSEGACDA